MQFGYSEVCLDHDTGDRHPESADRLRAIRQGLKGRYEVDYVDASPADEAVVEAVHDPGYVAELRRFCEAGGGNWDPDTVAVEATYDAALQSAGLAVWAAREALRGADGRSTPFSLGRPPGHHAEPDDAMGFCFFNNAAVAAQAVVDGEADSASGANSAEQRSADHSSGQSPREDGETASDPDVDVDRVAIFDWDVHHGNGTQDCFYDREDVFYASIHEEGLYPGTGDPDEIGEGDGEQTTLNAPLPAGSGDAEYCHVVDEVISPAIERFDPDLLIISAGFDAHRHDPISRMRVSTEGYALLTDRVRALAADTDAALAFVLEGGYGLDTLSDGVATVHETFDGRAPVTPDDDPSDDVASLTADLRERFDL